MNHFITLFATEDPKQYHWIFRYKDYKFQLTIKHDSDVPLGFNYKCCLDIMVADGTWSHVADNHGIGLSWEGLYWVRDDDKRIKADNARVCEAFKAYVKAVY